MKPWLKMVLKIISIIIFLGIFYWLISHSTGYEDRALYFYYFSDELDNTSILNIETNINNQSSILFLKDYTILSNLSFEKFDRYDEYSGSIPRVLKHDHNINLLFNKTDDIGLEKENTFFCEYDILVNNTILMDTEEIGLYHHFTIVGNGKNITHFIFVTNIRGGMTVENPMYDDFLDSARDNANFHIQNICDALGIEISIKDVHFVYSYLGSL